MKRRLKKMLEVKDSRHICGFCKHYDSDNYYCRARGEFEIYEEDSCEGWEEDDDIAKSN